VSRYFSMGRPFARQGDTRSGRGPYFEGSIVANACSLALTALSGDIVLLLPRAGHLAPLMRTIFDTATWIASPALRLGKQRLRWRGCVARRPAVEVDAVLVDFFAAVYAYLASHTLTPIAVVLFIEEAGIPSPIPGDGLMLMGGVRAAEGHVSLLTVLLVEEVATVIGALLLFSVSRRLGRPVVVKFGRYVGLTDDRLTRAEARFRDHDRRTIFIGRLIPGLRVPTVVAAGVLEVPLHRFLPAMAAGAMLNLTTFTVLGAVVGRPVLRLFEHLAFPAGAMWSLVALFGLTMLVREFRHSNPAKAGVRGSWTGALGAGTVAILVGILVDNILLDLVTFTGRLASWSALPTIRATEQAYLLLRWPTFLVAATALLAGAHLLRVDRMGRVARFAIYGLIPAAVLVVASFAVVPAMRWPTVSWETAMLLAATAAARWIAFGVTLELLQGNEGRHVTAPQPVPSGVSGDPS
jgi:membrane protein DedA with SNARE-associated domain